jgi:hypothetical protein
MKVDDITEPVRVVALWRAEPRATLLQGAVAKLQHVPELNARVLLPAVTVAPESVRAVVGTGSQVWERVRNTMLHL